MKHTIRDPKTGEDKQIDLTYRNGPRYFCIECMGGVISEIEGCTTPKCPLYPLRMGKPIHKKKYTEEQRRTASERMKNINSARRRNEKSATESTNSGCSRGWYGRGGDRPHFLLNTRVSR